MLRLNLFYSIEFWYSLNCRHTPPTKKVLKVLSKVNKRESKEPIIDSIVSAAAAGEKTHLFYKEKVNRFIHQNKQTADEGLLPYYMRKTDGAFVTTTTYQLYHHIYQRFRLNHGKRSNMIFWVTFDHFGS